MENPKRNRELKELYQNPSIMENITVRQLKWTGHIWHKEGSLLRIVLENSPQGKTPGKLEITLGRQNKRGCGKNRRGLQGNIIRKRKLKAIMLDDKVIMAKYHVEEEECIYAEGPAKMPSQKMIRNCL